MIISSGYILGHICEFLLFIYFADTSFYPRKNYAASNAISLCAYILLCGIGLLAKAPVSIISFFLVNAALLRYCYNINPKSAIFYAIILDMLSTIGEYIVVYILSIDFNNISEVTPHQTLVISAVGKLIYLIGVLLLKKFISKKITDDNELEILLAVIPLLSIVGLTLMMKTEIDGSVFSAVCVIFLVVNIITFYVNERLNDKSRRLKVLQEEHNKNKAELAEYQILYEKYESTKIMRHDFHKQLEVLKNLISTDNAEAKKYMQEIQFSQRELDYAQYTDNKILNTLLAQKIKESHKRGVEIHIHSKSPELSFISDIDTVAIFSNMLDNAIEAAEKAETKEIYVDLYTVNKVYSAVRIENYSEKEPVVLNGVLRTQKKNADMHGIGIKSINNALKKYNSELAWSYDKQTKLFKAIALIHVPKKAKRHD